MQKRITGQLYGLEKFWAYLEYSQSKTQPVDPKLQEYLSRFKKLEDFRVDLPSSEEFGRQRHSSTSGEERIHHTLPPPSAAEPASAGNCSPKDGVQGKSTGAQ
uniref:La ribonucleoprotein 1B n=1 Tax=Mus musculus TaxID=10090 RepID=Q497V3_MOUSE|nr:La ribonucleoprotein domain family, member 2 [Mus musculus]